MNTKISLYIISIIGTIIVLIVTVIFVDNAILQAVITTLIGSLITFLFGCIYEMIKYRSSRFTGYYRDEIFSKEDPSEIIKRDKFYLVEKSTNILTGNLKRYSPKRDKYANWTCSGIVVMDQLFLVYRPIEEAVPSSGIILVKLDTKRLKGTLLPCYSGKYFRFEGENIVDFKINLIKIEKEEYDNL